MMYTIDKDVIREVQNNYKKLPDFLKEVNDNTVPQRR